MPRTVLIVDDHDGFRATARALLEADGFDVIGEAADGEAAVASARRLRPDVVLLDVQLPGLDGFAVAERLAAADPRAGGRADLEPRRRRLPAPARRQPGAAGSSPKRSCRGHAWPHCSSDRPRARMPEALGDLVAGLALLIGGVAIWLRRPARHRESADGDRGSDVVRRRRLHRPAVRPPRSARARVAELSERPGAVADGGRRDRAPPTSTGSFPGLARSPWATIALMAATVSVAAWRLRAAASRTSRPRPGPGGRGRGRRRARRSRRSRASPAPTRLSAAVWTYDIAVAATARSA